MRQYKNLLLGLACAVLLVGCDTANKRGLEAIAILERSGVEQHKLHSNIMEKASKLDGYDVVPDSHKEKVNEGKKKRDEKVASLRKQFQGQDRVTAAIDWVSSDLDYWKKMLTDKKLEVQLALNVIAANDKLMGGTSNAGSGPLSKTVARLQAQGNQELAKINEQKRNEIKIAQLMIEMAEKNVAIDEQSLKELKPLARS